MATKRIELATVGWRFGRNCWLFVCPCRYRYKRDDYPFVGSLGMATIREDGRVLLPGGNREMWEFLDNLGKTFALKVRLFPSQQKGTENQWTGSVREFREVQPGQLVR